MRQKKYEELHTLEKQKTVRITSEGKGIRLDLFVQDTDNTVYNAEMQQKGKSSISKELPKRSRYYQGLLDQEQLEKGDLYTKLNKVYIIFICTFDPFGKDLYQYTFKNICEEDNTLQLDDQVQEIFFNAKGKKGNVSDEVKNFLKYLEKQEATDEYTKQLDSEVKKIRNNEEGRLEYMKTYTYDMELKEEGREEGREEGEKLYAELTKKLIEAERWDAMKRMADDGEYRQKLFQEYGMK